MLYIVARLKKLVRYVKDKDGKAKICHVWITVVRCSATNMVFKVKSIAAFNVKSSKSDGENSKHCQFNVVVFTTCD